MPVEVKITMHCAQTQVKILPPAMRKIEKGRINQILQEKKEELNKMDNCGHFVNMLIDIIYQAAELKERRSYHGKIYFDEDYGDGQGLISPLVDSNEASVEEITNQEAGIAVRKVKRSKTAAPCGISVEVLEDHGYRIPLVGRGTSKALKDKEAPRKWKCYIRPIFQAGDSASLNNYRGMSFAPHLCKMLTWIITQRVDRDHGHQIHKINSDS